jgi:hypothetical protein
VCVNGHEWAKRQAERRGIGFQALDNGFAATENAEALAQITGSLGAQDIERYFRRWEARLPSPLRRRIVAAATAMRCPCARSSSRTRACLTARPPHRPRLV